MVTTQRFAIVEPDLDRFATAFLGGLKQAFALPRRPGQRQRGSSVLRRTGRDVQRDVSEEPRTGKRETMTVLAMAKGDAVLRQTGRVP